MLAGACSAPGTDLLAPSSGGATTAAREDLDTFSTPAPNLDTLERRRFESGDRLFRRTWVAAPAQPPADRRDGLGPLFNADSCSACHSRDGRGVPPLEDGTGLGLLFRFGVADDGASMATPTLGRQLQDHAIEGFPPEGRVEIEYVEVPGTYPDGARYSLRRPAYRVERADPGNDGDRPVVSPRIAPAVFGMGLLEAIPEAVILASADPDDRDGDGISGRANLVWSVARGEEVIGRFGWKANVATVLDQVAAAFHEDIGITSELHPEEQCSPDGAVCRSAPSGDTPELSSEDLADVVFYASTLAVPARRSIDSDGVRRGADLFSSIGCTACHTARLTTGDHPFEVVAYQTIHPFTDLLLHDMGPGLADGVPDGLATGSEWRTPPLWGLGSIPAVNGQLFLLHDGRARSLEEAILWHGGEAESSRTRFVQLDADDRARVLAFLDSL